MKQRIVLIYTVLFLTGVVLICGCSKDSGTQVEDKQITPRVLALSVVDSSCTELWIKVSQIGYPIKLNTILTVNGSHETIFSFSSPDTIVYINNLELGSRHQVSIRTVERVTNIEEVQIEAQTLRKSSDQYSVRIWEFGENSISNDLYTSAVIDENDIWIGGNIQFVSGTRDIDAVSFNILHWNGTKWDTMLVPVVAHYGCLGDWGYAGIKSLFAAAKNNIWGTTFRGNLIHWNGSSWSDTTMWEWLNKITSDLEGPYGHLSAFARTGDNSFDAVGTGNHLASFNGTAWKYYQTAPEETASQDIAGTPDFQNRFVVGNYGSFTFFKQLYKGTLKNLFEGNPADIRLHGIGRMLSIAIPARKNIFILGANKLSVQKVNEEFNPSVLADASGYTCVRGTADNDLWLMGPNKVGHFNGKEIVKLPELPDYNVSYSSIDVKENLVVLCGYEGNGRSFVKLLKRK